MLSDSGTNLLGRILSEVAVTTVFNKRRKIILNVTDNSQGLLVALKNKRTSSFSHSPFSTNVQWCINEKSSIVGVVGVDQTLVQTFDSNFKNATKLWRHDSCVGSAS